MQGDQWGGLLPLPHSSLPPFQLSRVGGHHLSMCCAAGGRCRTSCLGLSLLWEHWEVFGCPNTCSGCCDNETPSHKVQQLLSEAGAATAAIALKHQPRQHTQSMGCNRAIAKSRSPPLLVSFPLKGPTHAPTSFSVSLLHPSIG